MIDFADEEDPYDVILNANNDKTRFGQTRKTIESMEDMTPEQINEMAQSDVAQNVLQSWVDNLGHVKQTNVVLDGLQNFF